MPIRSHTALRRLVRAACLALGLTGAFSASLAAPWKVRADTDVQLDVRQIAWRLQGPFAEQRVELLLRNPSARPVEATVLLPLGDGERLRAYALDINGELREAVPVERVQARVAFETMTARQVDPALVERDSDSDYRLRVFPIPARGERRLRIDLARLAERVDCGWRHLLTADALPAGAAQAALVSSDSAPGSLVAGLSVMPRAAAPAQGWVGELAMRGGDAPRELCLGAPKGPAGFSHRLDDGTQLHWLEAPVAEQAAVAVPDPTHLEIVWDASLRMPQDRLGSLQVLDHYLRGRSLDVTLTVLRLAPQRRAFHVQNGNWAALREALQALSPEGALDLGSWSPAAGVQQVLMFSEVRPSWPQREALKPPGLPVHLIGNQVADMAAAQVLMQDGGQWLDLRQRTPEAIAAQLRMTPATRIATAWDQLRWHAEARVPRHGVLRACHVQGSEAPEPAQPRLRLTHAGAERASHEEVQVGRWPPEPLAAFWCGSWWVQTLEAEPLRNKAQLARLGEQLGLVNRETSLLVLETVQDYINHGIMPPAASPALREAVLRGREQRESRRSSAAAGQRVALERAWAERQAWWDTDFALKQRQDAREAELRRMAERQREALERRQGRERQRLEERLGRTLQHGLVAPAQNGGTFVEEALPPPPPTREIRSTAAAPGADFVPPPEMMLPVPAPAPMPVPRPAPTYAATPAQAAPPSRPAHVAVPAPEAASPAITLRAVATNEPYAAELDAAQTLAALEAAYADLRPRYQESPAFHVDVAERFISLGEMARGVLVISNVVALMPREAAALRMVAYRLQGVGQDAPALDLLQRVQVLAPDEPQSWRDLGLALSRAQRCEEAAQALRHVVDMPWPAHFADIDLITLGELNALQTQCSNRAFDALPEALRRAMPVGLRVVLSWDLKDTDIDLHVVDPRGEVAFFGHRDTPQGGRLSRDFTAGYGPEEFILRRPVSGTYKVMVKYFGSRLAKLSRGATVQMTLQTGFGTAQPQSRTMTFRLVEGSGLLELGQFELDRKGRIAGASAVKPKPPGHALAKPASAPDDAREAQIRRGTPG